MVEEGHGDDGTLWVPWLLEGGGGGWSRRIGCQFCRRVLFVQNMVRHLRQSCPVWDPGGWETRPRSAVSWPTRKNAFEMSTVVVIVQLEGLCSLKLVGSLAYIRSWAEVEYLGFKLCWEELVPRVSTMNG